MKRSKAVEKDARPPGPYRILVVDDNRDFLCVARLMLEPRGFCVSEARCIDETVEQLLIERPHLVLMDIRLGPESGFDLFDRVHELDPSVPVVMLTGYAVDAQAAWYLRGGGTAYIDKDFKKRDLADFVTRVLAVKTREDPAYASMRCFLALTDDGAHLQRYQQLAGARSATFFPARSEMEAKRILLHSPVDAILSPDSLQVDFTRYLNRFYHTLPIHSGPLDEDRFDSLFDEQRKVYAMMAKSAAQPDPILPSYPQVVLVLGPSGSGKTETGRFAQAMWPMFRQVITAVERTPRVGEIAGDERSFVEPGVIRRQPDYSYIFMREARDGTEYAIGIKMSQIESILAKGYDAYITTAVPEMYDTLVQDFPNLLRVLVEASPDLIKARLAKRQESFNTMRRARKPSFWQPVDDYRALRVRNPPRFVSDGNPSLAGSGIEEIAEHIVRTTVQHRWPDASGLSTPRRSAPR